MSQQKSNLRVGRYSFWIALIGATIFLLAAIGVRIAPTELSRTVLAWLALSGSILLFGGLLVYVGFVTVVSVRKRTPEEDVTQDRR